MGKKKLSSAEEAKLRAAYESWNPHDPDSISADELAAQFGISKQTMYNMRRRWIQEDREARLQRPAGDGGTAEEVIRYLTDELVLARIRILELEELLDERRGGMSA